MFMAADEFPLPLRVPPLDFDGLVERAARRHRRAHGRLPRLRQHRPHAGRLPPAGRRAHPQHRPPPRQHALRHGQPRGARRLVHGRDRLGPGAGARASRSTPRSPTRSTSASSPTPAASCTRTPARGPPDGRRADRGRRGRRTTSTAALYEDLPFAPLAAARARAGRVERYDDGALTRRPTSRATTSSETGAEETDSEGISTTCAPSRAPQSPRSCASCSADGATACARSSCAPPTAASTSRAIARAQGGGGHRQAAGFTTELPSTSSSQFLRGAGREQLERRDSCSRRPGVLLCRQAGGRDLARRRGAACGARCRAAGRSATPARSTRSPPACCSCWSARATRAQRFLMALPKTYETVARLGWTSDTGDRDGELDRDRPRAGARSSCRPGEHAPAPAGLLGGEGRRRAGLRAGARRGEEVEVPARRVTRPPLRAAVARRRPRGVRDRVLVGHLRALADRRPGRRLLRGARRTAIGAVPRGGRRPRARRAARRGARVPAGGGAGGERGPPRRPRRCRPRPRRRGLGAPARAGRELIAAGRAGPGGRLAPAR